jgi:ribosome-associated translation inhibitor RaiA
MQVQLNTDKNIEGTDRLESFVADQVSSRLKHYTKRITRVEVHLSDQNADKPGPDDIQCKLETRPAGMKPILVASKGSTIETALTEALNKMKATLDTAIGKMKDH